VGAEVLDDGEGARGDAAHARIGGRGDLALLHGLLEHERGEDEVLLGGGAGADEAAVELHALPLRRDLRHGLAVVRGGEERHLRNNVAEVDGVAEGVLGALVGAEVEALGVVRLARREDARRLFVGLEDAGDAAELGAHVGDGEAGVGGHEAEAGAAPLDGALVGDGVALQDPEHVQDDVLAADAELGLADELDQARLGDLQPGVARDEGEGDVAGAEADGEGAHAAAGAGVRVSADDNLAGLRALAGELGVHDGRVGAPVVGDARLGGEVVGEPDERRGLGLAAEGGGGRGERGGEMFGVGPCVRGSREHTDRAPSVERVWDSPAPFVRAPSPHALVVAGVDGVVDGEPDAVLVGHARAADLGVHVVDAHQGQLVRHRPVHLDADRLAGLDPGPAEEGRGRGWEIRGWGRFRGGAGDLRFRRRVPARHSGTFGPNDPPG
jgi:hypothetical protein